MKESEKKQKTGDIIPYPSEGVVDILKKIDILKAAGKQTGCNAKAIIDVGGTLPIGLTESRITQILEGEITTFAEEEYEYIIKSLKKVPKERSYTAASQQPAEEKEHVIIDEETFVLLQELREKTDIGVVALLNRAKNAPEDLKASTAQNWISGKSKKARRDHLDFLLQEWRKYSQYEFVELTAEIPKELLGYEESTGIGPQALLRGTQKERPEGLSSDIIKRWLKAPKDKVRKDYLEFTLQEWRKYPQYEFVELTEEIHKKLLGYKESTGIGPQALLRGTQKERPEGLNSGIIKRWLAAPHKKVRKDHLDYVLARWKTLEQLEAKKIIIPDEILQKLHHHWKRTNIGPEKLLKLGSSVPRGLTSPMICQWLYKKTKTAREDHLDFVLEQWEALPESKRRTFSKGRTARLPQTMQGCVEVTPEIIKQLRELRNTTGVGVNHLLKKAKDLPEGLTIGVVSGWFNGGTATARKDHLEYMVQKWEALANSGQEIKNRYITNKDGYEPISQQDLEEMRHYRDMLNLLPGHLLKISDDVPEGLTNSMIGGWLSGVTQNTNPEFVSWVLERCRAVVKESYEKALQ